ncbi:MAG: DUF4900 domain-containing protein [Planctomycetales bacterium]|nr:DUF4900 domain-containing protein [bacterium]UNM08586.1 MAG: DUF4900 domain-containing protein [Planctomycetales bacterium]
MRTMEWHDKRLSRKGSTSILAIMVSLLLTILFTATLSLTMVDAELVHDHTRNKKAFQAADSGLVHSRRVLSDALSAWNMPTATTPGDVEEYAQDAEAENPSGNQDISLIMDTGENIDDVMPRNQITTSVTLEEPASGVQAPTVGYNTMVNIWPTEVERPAASDASKKHVFHYDWSVTSEGAADLNNQHNQATRVENGNFELEVKRPNFATYGYFTQTMQNQFNDQLWFFDGEVYDGPVHVNAGDGEGVAAFYGEPTFNGAFTAVQGSYEESILAGGANPQFNEGATWGVDQIDLPSNGWSQLRAAMGDYANIDLGTQPSLAEYIDILGLTGLPGLLDKGCYFCPDYNRGDSLLGGIFINGDANTIRLSTDGTAQVTEISMAGTGLFGGTNNWKFRESPATGQTEIWKNGTLVKTIGQLMNGMIHVNGSILNLTGDGSVNSPDIAAGSEITVSATGDIKIGGHITYAVDPADNPDADNILGIFSAGGNIMLRQDGPNNLNIDASMMAVSNDHGLGAEGIIQGNNYVYNYPNKGKLQLTGGLIENRNQTTGVYYSNGHKTGYEWDFTYDDRFQTGKAPPYFPYVTKFIMEMHGVNAEGWGRKYN